MTLYCSFSASIDERITVTVGLELKNELNWSWTCDTMPCRGNDNLYAEILHLGFIQRYHMSLFF